ncbi:MAG: class I SAM-dependent methyltransferase, partial [Bacteroidota bacterium]
MYSRFQLAKKYIHHYLVSSNGKGHGTHSPFVFDFIIHVLTDKKNYDAYTSIERLRSTLKNDTTVLEIEDFGAGSATNKTNRRAISEMAHHAAKSPKIAQLLFRIVRYYRPKFMLELGTSLGISASYLASGNPDAKLVTIEGASSIATVAQQNFESLGLRNTELLTGNFANMLPEILNKAIVPDLVFIDGNHRKEPTLNYSHQLLTK